MPTPFYHLSLAQEILHHAHLPVAVRSLLQCHLGAYLLGHVAPDVQVVSGQPRTETHFFDLPLKAKALPPWQQLLRRYPLLKQSALLTGEHRAFLVGYLCHLQVDWRWVQQIFVPVFGLQNSWSTFEQRLIYHNVLRAYLDEQILPSLESQWSEELKRVVPCGWLPFVNDRDLVRWRDIIAEQLKPGSRIATAEVFAARQGLSVEEFVRLVRSPSVLQEAIFSHISMAQLSAFRRQVIEEGVQLVCEYLQGR